MTTDHEIGVRVDARFGKRSIILAPVSVAVAALVAAASLHSPVVLLGVYAWVSVFCASGALVAALGVVLGTICWYESATAEPGADRRERAIRLGRVGVALSFLALVLLVFVWIWFPLQWSGGGLLSV